MSQAQWDISTHDPQDGPWIQDTSAIIKIVPDSMTHKWCPANNLACISWAEAPVKIARMTLTIKLDGNWSSFQLANNTSPLSVTDSIIAPSARMFPHLTLLEASSNSCGGVLFPASATLGPCVASASREASSIARAAAHTATSGRILLTTSRPLSKHSQ